MPPLTKAPFLDALTCPTKGWFRQHVAGGPVTWEQRWLFYQGQEVQRLAREWSGPGAALQPTPVEDAAEATRQAMTLAVGEQFFEATFLTDHAVARADILRRAPDGWTIVEVKSGQSPKPGEDPKAEYVDDLSYTVLVAEDAGVAVAAATLLVVNREYRLGMAAGERFVELDLTDAVRVRVEELRGALPLFAAQVSGDARPDPVLIPACKGCEYFEERCLGRDIPDPIFLLPRLNGKRFQALAPYGSIARLPHDVELTDNQREVFQIFRSGEPRVVPEVLQELDALQWPASYLDFETVMPALPWHPDEAPYTTNISQYSLHVLAAPGAAPAHHEYLATLETDWRRGLFDALLDALGHHGSIVVYSSYERVQLERGAELFPDLAPRISAVTARLFDLEPYFRKGYVHPAFRGSSSIKKVLPVLVPELSYDGMPVAGGGDAAALMMLMKVGNVPAMEHARHRAALLEYCKLDTLAMVRLHQALLQIRQDHGAGEG